MMVGSPLTVNFANVGTIVCSDSLWLIVTWYAIFSNGSDANDRKEERRIAWCHARNGSILSYHCISATYAVSRVYDMSGER